MVVALPRMMALVLSIVTPLTPDAGVRPAGAAAEGCARPSVPASTLGGAGVGVRSGEAEDAACHSSGCRRRPDR